MLSTSLGGFVPRMLIGVVGVSQHSAPETGLETELGAGRARLADVAVDVESVRRVRGQIDQLTHVIAKHRRGPEQRRTQPLLHHKLQGMAPLFRE